MSLPVGPRWQVNVPPARNNDLPYGFTFPPLRSRSRWVMGRRVRTSGVTLLEVMLAVAILIPVTALLYWFYGSSLETREAGLLRVRNVQLARVVLDRISREVRFANGVADKFGPGIVGEEHQLSLITVRLPERELAYVEDGLFEPPPPGKFDYREVSYSIGYDDRLKDEEGYTLALGLVRREQSLLVEDKRAVGPRSGGGLGLDLFRDTEFVEEDFLGEIGDEQDVVERDKIELYAPDIRFLEFAYFDGAQWWPDWPALQGNALPQMIRITIGFEAEPPELEEEELIDEDFMKDEDDLDPLAADRYSTVVRLLQADTFFASRLTRNLTELARDAGGDADSVEGLLP